MSKVIDLTGVKRGKLTVIKQVGTEPNNGAMWLCKCKCGNETVVPGRHLTRLHTMSCGCSQKKLAAMAVKFQSLGRS